MALSLVTPPTIEPVTLSEAKLAMRVDIDDDDTLIEFYITAARRWIEEVCRPRLAMLTQTWKYVSDEYPASDTVELPVYPLLSVTSVTYTDEADATTIVASSNYVVDVISEPGRIRLKSTASWPSVTLQVVNGFAVTFVAGFGAAASAVPAELRQAIQLLVAHQYENREPVIVSGAIPKTLEFTVMSLIGPWRREV